MELLRDLVHLRVGGRSGLVSRAYEAHDDRLVLGAPFDQGVQVAIDVGTPIEVGWMTKTGVRWHSGVVTASEMREDGIAIHVRVLDQSVSVDRRRHPRAKLCLDVTVTLGFGAETVVGRLLDVSAGGLALEIPVDLEVDDVVQAAIETPGGEPIRLSARVYRRDGHRYALLYELFAQGSRERLVELAFAQAAAA